MTFKEIKDLDLIALELRWSDGDKFALIEAVAYCAAQNREYPKWVRSQIDGAMTAVFQSVFPQIDFTAVKPALAWAVTEDQPSDKELKERFKQAVPEAIKALCLKIDRDNILNTRKRAIRDFSVAQLVADFAVDQPDPEPTFGNVEKTISYLEDALNLELDEWLEQVNSDGFLVMAEEDWVVPIRDVPLECRKASQYIIERAWSKYGPRLLELRQEQRQAR